MSAGSPAGADQVLDLGVWLTGYPTDRIIVDPPAETVPFTYVDMVAAAARRAPLLPARWLLATSDGAPARLFELVDGAYVEVEGEPDVTS